MAVDVSIFGISQGFVSETLLIIQGDNHTIIHKIKTNVAKTNSINSFFLNCIYDTVKHHIPRKENIKKIEFIKSGLFVGIHTFIIFQNQSLVKIQRKRKKNQKNQNIDNFL